MRSLRRGCSPGRAAGQSGGRSLPPAAENSRQTIEQQVSRAPRPARQPLSPTNPEAKPVIVAGWMGHGRQPALAEHRHPVSTGRRAVYTDMFNRVKALQLAGHGVGAIVCQTGFHWPTVAKWVRLDELPQRNVIAEAKHTKRFPRTPCPTLGRGLHVPARLAAGDQTAWLHRQPVSSGPAAWRVGAVPAVLSPSTRSRLVVAAGGLGVVPRGFGEALEMREQGRGGRRIGEDRPVR